MYIFRHPRFAIAECSLIFTQGHARTPYALVLPVVLGHYFVYLLGHHLLQRSAEELGQAEFPLHQIAHEHHQVLAEALEHGQVALYVLHPSATFLHAAIHLVKELRADAIDVLNEFLATLGINELETLGKLKEGDTIKIGLSFGVRSYTDRENKERYNQTVSGWGIEVVEVSAL